MKKILLFTALMSSSVSLKSQTAGVNLSSYTDVNPDYLLKYTAAPYTHQTYSINMVIDPQPDIQFIAHGAVSSGGSSTYINLTSLNTNVYIAFGRWDSVFVPGGPSWNVTKIAKPFNIGDPLTASNIVWDNTTLYLTDQSGAQGGVKNVTDWIGGDKYIGIKYLSGNNTTYGWIRVNCVSQDSCFVKDFSSGSATTGLFNMQSQQAFSYPNPVADYLYVVSGGAVIQESINLYLFDRLGRKITPPFFVHGNQIQIDLRGLSEGCYVLKYSLDEITRSQRIIISNR